VETATLNTAERIQNLISEEAKSEVHHRLITFHTSQHLQSNPCYLLQERKRARAMEEILITDCSRLYIEYQNSRENVDTQNTNLAQFLCDQGDTIGAVEQAEALNTKLQRRQMRRKAHNSILQALRGGESQDGQTWQVNIEVPSPSLPLVHR